LMVERLERGLFGEFDSRAGGQADAQAIAGISGGENFRASRRPTSQTMSSAATDKSARRPNARRRKPE
jgi:hypothetical protein